MNKVGPTICQVLHSLTIGGAEVLAARLVRALKGRYRFVFACLDDVGPLGEELRAEGFTVRVIGRRPGIDFRSMRAMASFWREEKVDVVHAHQYTPFFYSLGARAWRSRPPVFFTEHGRFFPDYPRRKRMWFNRLMLGRRDRVVGVGEAVRQALIENEGISSGRVEVIYNGVETEAFKRAGSDTDAVRRTLGMSPDDFVVLQVARLDYLKDHLTAIRTVHRVAETVPNARLVLVGDGPEREKIEQEIDRLGVTSNVLLTGFRSDVATLYHAADAFLLTSISEGIPVTVIEAMAAGLPVVATDVGGLSEIVLDGEAGYLVPAGDDAALAKAVVALAGDPDLRGRMGAAGQRRACGRFSQDQMHAGYVRVYDQLLQGK